MNDFETILAQLKENGCRITPQRKEIVRILVSSTQHPTAEELYQRLQPIMPETSLATVYNTLNRLKELGLVDMLGSLGEESVRFDPTTDPHDHLYCLGCGRIIDIERRQTEPAMSAQHSGFQVVREQTTFYGYCAECRAKTGND
jgi:Fur family transcriptional regulator, peroxide stress response regulator